jgi:PAT family beta-lactamase induction signal transducer AmpG
MFAVAATHGFDQFSGGLGTAVLMTFLMRICLKEFRASHYAIGTGLMSVSGLYAGVISGFLTSWVGYGYFFGISFLLSLPGMALIFWLPLYDNSPIDSEGLGS